MCRWIAYIGEPVYLEQFLLEPRRSLVAQSRRCREASTETNADGFGVGWYGSRERPGVFRDIRPAWGDENLMSIAHQISARLFLAHVRASTGTATSRANCHPFGVGQWLFMHNGQIGGWEKVRRQIEAAIPDELFEQRIGTTDSEALFLMMLGNALADDPERAAHVTLGRIETMMREAGIACPLRFTAAFTDGSTLHAVRYASDGRPPSLYTRRSVDGSVLVASEPLDESAEGWQPVPAQSILTVRDGTMVCRPFVASAAAVELAAA
jgi:predicted glutamine amidotransferase